MKSRRSPIIITQEGIGVTAGAFVTLFVAAVFLGAIQAIIAQIIWNHISSVQYHVNFWQAWGGFVILKMALGNNSQVGVDKKAD